MSDLPLLHFSEEGKALVAHAQQFADEKHHTHVDPCHLLAYALEHYSDVAETFKAAKIDVADLEDKLKFALGRFDKAKPGVQSVLHADTINLCASLEKAHKKDIGVDLIVQGLTKIDHGAIHAVCKVVGITPTTLEKAARRSSFISDLRVSAKLGKFDPVVGRDTEIRRLFQILGRRDKNNPLLVGLTGVGKTAIVNAMATRMANKDAPKNILGLAILELDLNAIMAGTKARGEVDERMKKVFADLQPNTVVVIANLENLFSQSGVSGTTDILKHTMNKPNIHILASTTVDGHKKILDKDPGLMGGFSQVFVDPTSPEQTNEIIRAIAPKYEAHHGVAIGTNAASAAVRLAKRYLQDQSLPGSAISLLDEAAARKRMEMGSKPAKIDDLERRLSSLRIQRASLVDKKSGLLRSEFVDDKASIKVLKAIEKEITEIQPELEKTKKGSAVSKSDVSALRNECADLVGKRAKAEMLKETNTVREIDNELSGLKIRLAEAEKAVADAPEEMVVSNVVSEENVAAVLEDWKGISAQQMCESEVQKLAKMEERLTMRVMGQAEAVSAVSKAIRRSRLGLRDAHKPIGSFLFLGSSGVGKTELAKALAEFLFDDENNLVRLDMSEFQEKHMVSRLLGAPQGYQDSAEGGMLTNAIKQKPYSVLLIDELEKGAPEIFTLFLQILDDARLSSSRGETVDFSNTVVIFTSNIGTKQLLDAPREKFATPEGREELALIVRNQLKEQMRPELINRLDKVVLFNPLEKPTLKGIIDVRLRELDKMLESRELKVRLTDAAKDQIVEEGNEPAFGARPIARALVQRVRDPLAEELMSGSYAPGSIISVDYAGGLFSFSSSAAA